MAAQIYEKHDFQDFTSAKTFIYWYFEVYFLLDIMKNFTTEYRVAIDSQKPVTDLKLIARHYLHNDFKFDLMMQFPYYIIFSQFWSQA